MQYIYDGCKLFTRMVNINHDRCSARTQIYELCECQNNDSTIARAVLNQLPVFKHNPIGCIQVKSIIICIAENIDYMYILYMLNSPLPKVKYTIK